MGMAARAVYHAPVATKTALITGITGQTGSYLAELLLSFGYIVHGIIRRTSTFATERIDHLYQDPHVSNRRLVLHYGDLQDASSLERILGDVEPDEIYNLAAQSHVRVSFDQPVYTADTVALGALRMLEAMRWYQVRTSKRPRFYQASSSEMFGHSPPPQSVKTPFRPRSPYAAAKVFAYHLAQNYREGYGLHITNGILFNHESPRRLETFVTRKITMAAARIKVGLQKELHLGNLDAKRDWGHARDYADAIWRIVQHDEPRDWVVATGISHSVREFADVAFELVGLQASDYIRIDPRYLRPTEVDFLCGDNFDTVRLLHWEPRVTIDELVREMITHDLELAKWEKKKRQG
jgi:GDPmannose 4,6-dehydratase